MSGVGQSGSPLPDGGKRTLDLLVREARSATADVPLDWHRVEKGLFERARANAVPLLPMERVRVVPWVVAGTIAAAAAFVLLLGRSAFDDAASSLSQRPTRSAGSFSVEGRVDGRTVMGGTLREGERLESNTEAILVQTARNGDPRAIRWSVESQSAVTVTSASPTVILALTSGAVEAEVTPVKSGEAFAVDVGDTRIAVHGTHLRVSRAGDHVTLDLTEGVVALGVPPRSGMTVGTIVSAPAHAEFDIGKRETTFVLARDPAAVRSAHALGDLPAAPRTSSPSAGTAPPAPHDGEEAAALSSDAGFVAVRPRGHAPVQVPSVHPNESDAAVALAPSEPAEALAEEGAALPPFDSDPAATIQSAVATCTRPFLPAAGIVVSISTRVVVTLDRDGLVRSARFDPPLVAGAQACAAKTIYATRFAAKGPEVRTIPVEIRPKP